VPWRTRIAPRPLLDNAFDDRRVFDAGDDLQRPAAVAAGLDVDSEHAL
jgi:hypothetical protein